MSKTLCKQHHDDTDDGYYGGTIQNTTVSVVVNPDNHGFLFDLWQDLSLEDASFHDSVVGTVGFAVFRGMTDGISSDGEDAVDELLDVLCLKHDCAQDANGDKCYSLHCSLI